MKELISKLAEKLNVSKETVLVISLVFFGTVLSGADKLAEPVSNIGEFFTGFSTGLSAGLMIVGIIFILFTISKPSSAV